MRKSLATTVLGLVGVLFASGGAPEGDPAKLRLVYSSDLRAELHPCG